MLAPRAAALPSYLSVGIILHCWRRVRGQRTPTDSDRVLDPPLRQRPNPADVMSASPPPPDPSPSPWQRSRFGFDYVLVVATCLLFVAYIPVFIAAPRLAQTHLDELDLLWFVPLVLMLGCLGSLTSWVLLGAAAMGRILWTLVLVAATAACPAGYVAIMTMSPPPPPNYAGPPQDPQPVWEPVH